MYIYVASCKNKLKKITHMGSCKIKNPWVHTRTNPAALSHLSPCGNPRQVSLPYKIRSSVP